MGDDNYNIRAQGEFVMGPKLLLGLTFAFFFCTVISFAVDGIWFGTSDLDVANELTGYSIQQLQGSGFWAVPQLGWGFFTHGFPQMLTWDYSYLEGSLFPLRLGLIIIFSTIFVWAIVTTFISVIQGVFSR